MSQTVHKGLHFSLGVWNDYLMSNKLTKLFKIKLAMTCVVMFLSVVELQGCVSFNEPKVCRRRYIFHCKKIKIIIIKIKNTKSQNPRRSDFGISRPLRNLPWCFSAAPRRRGVMMEPVGGWSAKPVYLELNKLRDVHDSSEKINAGHSSQLMSAR